MTRGLYSRGLLSWLNPLLLDGFRRLLKPADLYALDESMKADVLNQKFWTAWKKVKPSSSNRLLRSCTSTLKWPLVGVVLPRLLQLALTICQPLVLNRFLAFLEDRESIDHGYGLIGACGLVYLGIALSGAFYSHQATRTVTMLGGILVSAIFARPTDLGTTAVDNAAAGALVQRVVREDFAPHTHRLETVVGFDRVVVLEKGCVAEEGCPRELLAWAGGSRFRALWDASRRAGR
ncbi:putative abc multidrug transporter [Diaporthe ampelina]|uniref:Putative abc multidrug transporter n=1 Tax=Diaporthe ampelina TaxID=1214573 RepID=A0A0G2FG70_9PEZI|nr:putative abc multidrug transporter [Diaporthe ampelina]